MIDSPTTLIGKVIMTSLEMIAETHPAVARQLSSLDDLTIHTLLRRLLAWVSVDLCRHDVVIAYTDSYLGGEIAQTGHAARLVAVSQELDERYFKLQESGEPESVWSAYFHEARLASALAIIAAGPTKHNLGDILYEMAHSHDSPSGFLDRVAQELDQLVKEI